MEGWYTCTQRVRLISTIHTVGVGSSEEAHEHVPADIQRNGVSGRDEIRTQRPRSQELHVRMCSNVTILEPLAPNDTIWCHHGHGLSIYKLMGIYMYMGSLILGDIL